MDMEKYLDLFLEEGREHVTGLRARLTPQCPSDPGVIQEVFRSAHSIKGMAASMSFEFMTRMAHALEDLFNRWRQGEPPTPEQEGLALRAVDALDALMDRVQSTKGDTGLEEPLAPLLASLEHYRSQKPGTPGTTDGEPPLPPPPAGPAPEPPRPIPAPPRAETGVPVHGPADRIRVFVDPSSPMPAARLLVVAARIHQSLTILATEPPLAELQKGATRSVLFTVPRSPELKDLARSLKELPEITQVELEESPEVEEASARAPLVQSVRVRATDLDALLAATSELLTHLNQLEAGLAEAERRHHRFWLQSHRSLLNRLFDRVLSVRLVSFEALTARIERTARDLASRLNKPVRVEVTGADQQVDRNLLEKLLDPLTHLVRNALDHGIEPPAERAAAGKSPEGSVTLIIRREAESLLIQLVDDGRGLDVEAIRRKAVEQGLFPAAAASALSPAQVVELISLPSFSTKETVTEVSGRGVGMDVVRSSIESMGGRLEVESKPGEGCCFSLVIPAAVTLTEVLVFRMGQGTLFALPTSQVTRLYPLAQHPVVKAGNRRFLQAQEELIPVLEWGIGRVDRQGCGLRLAGRTGDYVLLVPEVLQSERVVVQPLGPPLDMIPEWIGGAHLSTGEIATILDGRNLVRLHQPQGPSAGEAAAF
jgi:two-component system chemotaxis sensor kinase CheA